MSLSSWFNSHATLPSADSAQRCPVTAAARRFGSWNRSHLLDTDDDVPTHEVVEYFREGFTQWFRTPQDFAILAHMVMRNPWRYQNIRVLSAGCSTKEEPYSLAYTLLAAGVNPWVVGMDMSEQAIQYSLQQEAHNVHLLKGRLHDMRKSIDDISHTPTKQILTPWFEQLTHQVGITQSASFSAWNLSQAVQERTAFLVGNLAAPFYGNSQIGTPDERASGEFHLPVSGTFDVIFLRNVLMHLATEVHLPFLAALTALLPKSGMLFLGECDTDFGIQSTIEAIPQLKAYTNPYIDITAPDRIFVRV